jgi:hypothetical protein
MEADLSRRSAAKADQPSEKHLPPPPPLQRTLAPAMSAGFDAAIAKVKELVADFRANEKFHLSPAYSDETRAGQEQEARRDFIDKFCLAIGWDVNHENLDGETHKFQGLNFQNGNTLGRIRSRSDGRCLFKKETFASDGWLLLLATIKSRRNRFDGVSLRSYL